MSKPTKSITEQIQEAVASVGTQREVLRRIEADGSRLRQAQLSELCNGQRPSLETLVLLARATGYRFELAGDTELGMSRASRPSEASGAAAEAPGVSRRR